MPTHTYSHTCKHGCMPHTLSVIGLSLCCCVLFLVCVCVCVCACVCVCVCFRTIQSYSWYIWPVVDFYPCMRWSYWVKYWKLTSNANPVPAWPLTSCPTYFMTDSLVVHNSKQNVQICEAIDPLWKEAFVVQNSLIWVDLYQDCVKIQLLCFLLCSHLILVGQWEWRTVHQILTVHF